MTQEPEPRQFACQDNPEHGMQPVRSTLRIYPFGVACHRLECLHVAVVEEGEGNGR